MSTHTKKLKFNYYHQVFNRTKIRNIVVTSHITLAGYIDTHTHVRTLAPNTQQ